MYGYQDDRSQQCAPAAAPWHPNTMSYLSSRQMDYVLQMKRQEFDQTIKSIRYVCDDVIRESVCKGKLPVEFVLPKKLLNKEFNTRMIVVELVRSLEADGFYTQLSPTSETTLHIYPKNIASCSFLNMSESARTFVQQIKSVEQDKMIRHQSQPTSVSSSSSGGAFSYQPSQQQQRTTTANKLQEPTPTYSTKTATHSSPASSGTNATTVRLVGTGYAPPSPHATSSVL
jgi:hypothetical protein